MKALASFGSIAAEGGELVECAGMEQSQIFFVIRKNGQFVLPGLFSGGGEGTPWAENRLGR